MKNKDVAKGTIQITLTDVVRYGVMALFYVIIAKTNTLTPQELGYFSILIFISNAASLSLFNLPLALTKFISQKLGRKETEEASSIFKTGKKILLILNSCGLLVIILISSPLSVYFWGILDYNILIILIGLEAFFINLINTYNSGLKALGLFNKIALSILIYIITSRAIAVSLAFLGFGLTGVVTGFLIGSIFGAITAIISITGNFIKTEKNYSIRPLITFSFPLFLSALATIIITQVDVIVIASLTSAYELVGVYSVILKSLLALNIVWQPILITIFPLLSSQFGLKKSESISQIIKTTSRYISYSTIPCCLILIIIGPTVLDVFYGSEYISGASALSILAISTILFSFINLLTTTLAALGYTKDILKVNLTIAILSLLFLFFFIPFFDIIGAAISKLISYTLSLILLVYSAQKFVKIQLDIEAIWKSIFASFFTLPFLFMVEKILNGFPVFYLLVIDLLIAFLIYFVILYLLKALNRKDFDLLRQAFPKFLSKFINFIEELIVR
jgi:stage V sporulation protein B